MTILFFYHFTMFDHLDNPGDLWHWRHWLKLWQLGITIYDNLYNLTIKSDTGHDSICNSCDVFVFHCTSSKYLALLACEVSFSPNRESHLWVFASSDLTLLQLESAPDWTFLIHAVPNIEVSQLLVEVSWGLSSTRSLGALQAPTSSWWPFGPAWLRPSRPSGAQAAWPT